MFRVFEATTADLLWQKVADAFRSGEFQRSGGTRGGDTNEILHTALTISDSRQRWVVSRRPALNVAFALAEIVWIMRGRNDSAFLNYFNRELPKFAGMGETYHGSYGARLRTAFGFDQLEGAYNVLKANPKSRQTVLQIWNPSADFPDNEGRPVNPDIPCNISALLKIRAGKLEWLQIMRSNDVFRGLPYNLVQFTTLHEIMAGWLGLDPGEYHHVSDSLHVYENSAKNVSGSMATPVAKNEDNLAISKSQSDVAFEKLENLVEKSIMQNTSTEELAELVDSLSLPVGHQNMAFVLCAESARRRGRRDLAEKIMTRCTNEVFAQLYEAWLFRVGGVSK